MPPIRRRRLRRECPNSPAPLTTGCLRGLPPRELRLQAAVLGRESQQDQARTDARCFAVCFDTGLIDVRVVCRLSHLAIAPGVDSQLLPCVREVGLDRELILKSY